jgi:hypothetical protein
MQRKSFEIPLRKFPRRNNLIFVQHKPPTWASSTEAVHVMMVEIRARGRAVRPITEPIPSQSRL